MNTPASQALADSVAIGFEAIYQFQFRRADSIRLALQKSHPKHAWTSILTVNYYWWQIITGNDSEALRKEYLQQINVALKRLDEKEEDLDHLERYTRITLYGFKARIEILNKRYISVVSLLNSYISNLKTTFDQEPEFEWYYLTSGIYNYYMERAKATHPVLRPYLSLYPKGDLEKGLEQLATAQNSTNLLLRTEAEYFLLKINLEEEEALGEAESNADALVTLYPENVFYRYLYYTILLQQKKLDKALQQYGQISVHAKLNEQLSETQKAHFIRLAKEDLTRYYIETGKTGE
ncbi:MAG: hypothetical protein ACFB10_01815 [Salibacteraceae bacterium]